MTSEKVKTSIYTNVSYHKHNKKWEAKFIHEKRTYRLWYFMDQYDAAVAVDKNRLEMGLLRYYNIYNDLKRT